MLFVTGEGILNFVSSKELSNRAENNTAEELPRYTRIKLGPLD